MRVTDRYRAAEVGRKGSTTLAVGADDRKGLASALTIKGQLSEDADNFSDALNYYLKALDIYIELNSEEDIASLRSMAVLCLQDPWKL
ncbi:MAG: hypothetical protein R2758_00675 [Bacteroidales bacterium]